MSFFEVENLHFSYRDGATVLKAINLHLRQGEIGALLGPSGSGKSSLLRCIAGFEKPLRGRISVAGKNLTGESDFISPHQRQIGYLFQNLALFPHMTVAQNILYGIHTWSESRQQQRLDELLQLTGLQSLKNRRPHQISGGERQRVALARALAAQPQLLLMDEPFSSLDPDLRQQLRREIREILKTLGTTALIVTHDLDEAYEMSDCAGRIQNGELKTWAVRESVFQLVDQPRATLKI